MHNKLTRAYYEGIKNTICSYKRDMYALSEPRFDILEQYRKRLKGNFIADKAAKNELIVAFKKLQKDVDTEASRPLLADIACTMASSRLISKAMQLRRENVKELVKSRKSIFSIQLTRKSDLGESIHSASTEPYFYESAYQFCKHDSVLTVLRSGQSVLEKPIIRLNKDGSNKPIQWRCSNHCKKNSDQQFASIVSLRQDFDKTMPEVREVLKNCDNGCPNFHYDKSTEVYNEVEQELFDENGSPYITKVKVVEYVAVERDGHPFVCYIDGSDCNSRLRILRCASIHYPLLSHFVKHVYTAKACSKIIQCIDSAISCGNYGELMRLTGACTFDSVLEVEDSYQMNQTETNLAGSALRQPGLENKIRIKHAVCLANFQKEIDDMAVNPCICCERLLRRSGVVKTSLSDIKLKGPIWDRLKAHVLKHNPSADEQQLYICNHCKPIVRKGLMPNRCVLNGLETVPIPLELENFNFMEKHCIQSFMRIVSLRTYSLKAPSHNSLKASKGAIFYLPLPTKKTMETLDQVNSPDGSMPDPELYIIVNSTPTKNKVVYRNKIDVVKCRTGYQWLTKNNRFYHLLDDDALDVSTKKVIEVVDNTSCTVLEKADEADLADLQSYTIRNLDNKLPIQSDLDQYKMNRVQEFPLDSRQEHLDVLAFPSLFPDGNFGEHHFRQQTIKPAEYAKSKLINKDARFRKDQQYLLFLYHQMRTRGIVTGIYNLLKVSNSGAALTIGSLLNQVTRSDEQLEANLSTIFQSVRGTRQYWFIRKCEVECMVREFGPPTLFLTCSCAEYESADIAEYLKLVNGIPLDQKCDIGKLCTLDPVSVTRQFTHKFTSFFKNIIVKGKVFGEVKHWYWKKEYQARGAPHYHFLLWIKDAPVVGETPPEKVLSWIQERISCHIPNPKTNPELHRLVTRYQLHKCTTYCKRKQKLKGTNAFITKCRFGFPRSPSEEAHLNPVEGSLKCKNKLYQLCRSECEVRVNDYNPTLMLAWKANIDVQFVAESSRALAKYITGYVTKAEKCNLHEVFQNVNDNLSKFGRLFSFAQQCFRSKECGPHEAADLLLGNHLCEKSVQVKYIDVSPPWKHKRRTKPYKEIQALYDKEGPDSKNIFMTGLRDTHYPCRPVGMEEMCLYDFVKWVDWSRKDNKGKTVYRTVTKPKLPNHKQLNP